MTSPSNFTKEEIEHAQKNLESLCVIHEVEVLSFTDTNPDSRLWRSLVLAMCGLQSRSKGRPNDPKTQEIGELAYLLSEFWAQMQESETGEKVKMEEVFDEVIRTLNIQPKKKAHGGFTDPQNTVRRAYQNEKTKRKNFSEE